MRTAKRDRKVHGGEEAAVVSKTTVILCFEQDAGLPAAARALKALGVSGEGDHRSRWFEPGLLTVRVDTAVPKEIQERLAGLPGVRRVTAMPTGQRLVSRAFSRADSAVALAGGALLGDGTASVIAGPCSVESESQVCEIAEMVKSAGATALRGGAFKPRTSPYSFGGIAERGLEFLVRAREQTGLPFATEALDEAQLDLVARTADIIQIGSRNMSNFPFLFKAGLHPAQTPILLKRGFASSIEEYLDAAEYILLGRLLAGAEHPGLILCERGIRTFETATRYTLDVAAIPILQERSGLPVIADPSHAAGKRRFVPHLSRAAVAAGADGLIVEVHTEPEKAWCDGDQTVSPEQFRALMRDVQAISGAVRSR
ncbi:MAG: 3-deoxy-7-phosphoheptulonate synthase [Planctomycetes bacterium]|nr:3-deoxy-7-phosphoheptulonate synthase [Planctomycetota bacterium]